MTVDTTVREQVRQRYAEAAVAASEGTPNDQLLAADSCCAPTDGSCCGGSTRQAVSFGATRYDAATVAEASPEALEASLGCGNPTAMAELVEGERVLDLGSGGGIDVLLAAKRVGTSGFAQGVDMTDEMLELARANATKVGLTNTAFHKGTIEDIPLEDATVDVVISNCVINLSTDKPAVFAEMFRVLAPGGRVIVSDVVAEDRLSPADRAERGSYVGCIAGALSRTEYLDGLGAVGFVDADVEFTHDVADGMHGAIIRARRPTVGTPS